MNRGEQKHQPNQESGEEGGGSMQLGVGGTRSPNILYSSGEAQGTVLASWSPILSTPSRLPRDMGPRKRTNCTLPTGVPLWDHVGSHTPVLCDWGICVTAAVWYQFACPQGVCMCVCGGGSEEEGRK